MQPSLQVALERVFASKHHSTIRAACSLLAVDSQNMPRQAFFIQGGPAMFPVTWFPRLLIPRFDTMDSLYVFDDTPSVRHDM